MTSFGGGSWQEIYASLVFGSSNALESIAGLRGLHGPHFGFYFHNLPKLRSLHGLEKVTSLTGDLNVFSAPLLESVFGLSGIQRFATSEWFVFSMLPARLEFAIDLLHGRAPWDDLTM